jgi:TonB family protein
MRHPLVAIAVALAGALFASSAPHSARADDAAKTSLERGTRARPVKRPNPHFPPAEARKGIEGWVQVSFVVEADGSVGETLIEDSSGNRNFERETIRNRRRWRYEPATMNGNPVEQCHTKVLVTFALQPRSGEAGGARRSFKKQYYDVMELLNRGKLEDARGAIDAMDEKFVTNLYERSRLWILRSLLQEKEGDDLGQLKSLQRAISGGGEYVESRVHLTVLLKIFNLQMQFQHYADALKTLEAVEALGPDAELAAKVAHNKQEIEALKTSDRAVAIAGQIGEADEDLGGSGMWWHALIRRTAGIESVSGSLDRVELRCDWRRVKAKPDKQRAWRIPAEWGDCGIYVIGEPGSTFQLIEYPSTPS